MSRHLLHFGLKDLEALLDKCGFEMLRSKHFSLRDNPQGWPSASRPPRSHGAVCAGFPRRRG
jgi:hypothetical protein